LPTQQSMVNSGPSSNRAESTNLPGGEYGQLLQILATGLSEGKISSDGKSENVTFLCSDNGILFTFHFGFKLQTVMFTIS
ncbi:hypothetical protein MKW94_012996, partial [Papaver nudicaule]|nr:hypothetical protein [Papaver nudicaule]